jgi:ABC-2 type transport system ATP-binding protein
MKQRLAIASALLNDPEILILDEPTNGLDPQGIHEIRQIIKDIAKNGTTILLASHLLDEVEKVCTHVLIIRNGVKLYSGSVDNMVASNGVIEVKTDTDIEKLVNVLKNYYEIASVNVDGNLVTARLENEISASQLNKHLYENGIIVSHLVKRKLSLEQQFLDLTNNN